MLTSKLIARGDYVAIEEGLPVVKPASGKPVPNEWLRENSDTLIKEILDLTDCPAYRFTRHTTGTDPKYTSDRLTLWFCSVRTGLEVLTHFNVDIKRKRNIPKNKAGSKLPDGKFTPQPHSRFIRWWRNLKLPTPRYRSEYHEKLHLLKPLLITGTTYIARKDEVRFQDKNIEFLSIDYERIKLSVIHRELVGKSPVTHRELIGNNDREAAPSTLDNIRVTDNSECGTNTVRLKNNAISMTNKAPKEQTTDEWLCDYE